MGVLAFGSVVSSQEVVGVEFLLMEDPMQVRAVWEFWTMWLPADLSSMALAPPGPTSASAGLSLHSIHDQTLGLGPFPQYQSWVLASTVPVPPVRRCFVE